MKIPTQHIIDKDYATAHASVDLALTYMHADEPIAAAIRLRRAAIILDRVAELQRSGKGEMP